MMNYMCRDLEATHDVSAPAEMIRQDISRAAPFNQDCMGCHATMDGLSGAFAYYNYSADEERITYDATQPQSKYFNNNDVFPKGFVTTDDSWKNFMRLGPNSSLGWSQTTGPGVSVHPRYSYSQGRGAKSLGEELSRSKAFSACAVKQVFESVCNKKEKNFTAQDKSKVEEIASTFEASNYNYKEIWVESALYCLVD